MDTTATNTPATNLLGASIAASGLPPIIDAEQCATLLRCSKQHVEVLADRGELPATKYGRGWVFLTAQLLAHVAAACERNLAHRSDTGQSTAPAVGGHAGAEAGEDGGDRLLVVAPRRRPGRPRKSTPA